MNKNKNFFAAILIVTAAFFASPLKAQVTIGENTPPDANAVLDLRANNKLGLLLPRLNLTSTASASPLSAHVKGMVVYNLVSAGTAPNAVTPGFYYDDGTQWVRLTNQSELQTAYTFAFDNATRNFTITPSGGTAEVINIPDANTFPALSSTTGLVITGSGTAAQTVNLPSGTNGQVLTSNGTTWSAQTLTMPAAGTWNKITTATAATLNTDDIYQTGKVGIGSGYGTGGSINANVTLEVNGSAANKSSFDAGTGVAIDFTKSNLAASAATGNPAFTLSGMKDGGTYTLAWQQTSAAGTASFTTTGFTPKTLNNVAKTAAQQVVYTIVCIKTTAYIYAVFFN